MPAVAGFTNMPKLRFQADGGSEYARWATIPFDEAFDFLGNNTLSRAELNYEDGKMKNIHYGDILVKFSEAIDVSDEKVPFVNPGSEPKNAAAIMLQDGDIVIADTAEDYTAGKAVEVCGTNTQKAVSGLHTIPCRPHMKFAGKFLGYAINAPAYQNQLIPLIQGIKVSSISKSALAGTSLCVPSAIPEQQKIVTFFTAIDDLISAQTDRVAGLEEYKKGMMQKIFSQQVRFIADDGSAFPEWKEKRFGDVFIERVERNREDLPPLTIIQGKGTVLRSECNRRISFDEGSLPGYKHTIRGDFIIHLRTFEGGLEMTRQEGIVSPAYHVYQGNAESILPEFYEPYFRSRDFIAGPLFACVIGIRDGKSIDIPAFEKTKIPVPSLPEQQKIAAFFSAIDDAINAAKDKLAGYQDLKKAMLQQMFV